MASDARPEYSKFYGTPDEVGAGVAATVRDATEGFNCSGCERYPVAVRGDFCAHCKPLTITATRSDGQPPARYTPSLIRFFESFGFTVQRVDVGGTDVLGTVEDFAPLEAPGGGAERNHPAGASSGAHESCDGMGI